MTYPSLDTAIYSHLVGDAGVSALVGVNVYNQQAPSGTNLPYVIFYHASGTVTNQQERQSINEMYRVESRADTRAGCEALHHAVYDALHRQALTVSGWANWWLVVENQQQFIENTGGVQYWRRVWDLRIRMSEE